MPVWPQPGACAAFFEFWIDVRVVPVDRDARQAQAAGQPAFRRPAVMQRVFVLPSQSG